jgi:hypothetical protein
MNEHSSRSGRVWYALAGLLVLLGIALFSQFLISRLQDLGGDLRQVVVPGTANLALDEAGEYTIFHERRSVIDGQYYASSDISGLRVTLTGPGGAAIPLDRPAMSSRFTVGGREAFSIFTFRIEQPGTYRLTAAYPDGRIEPKAVLSVGHDFMAGLLTTIFGAIAIGFATFGLGIAIFVVTLVKRRNRPQPGGAGA